MATTTDESDETDETDDAATGTPASDAAWDFVRSVLDDLAVVVREDARDARERAEGYRVLTRILGLCTELSIDVDPDVPRLFAMSTPQRQVGGPNPDGEYDLCTLTPGEAYRLRGDRGTVAYLGFQVMAGVGLSPRRQAIYVSDRELVVDDDGRFELVFAPHEPAPGPGRRATWVEVPDDASAIVVRQYVADRRTERLATFDVTRLDPHGEPALALPPAALDDATLAEQLTALGWTAVKLMTLHRTVMPELIEQPNRLVTAEAVALGSENTTPDNLYMLGVWDLGADEVMELRLTPPGTRYWSVTLENIWHECLEPRRRRSSMTNATAVPEADGTVRIIIGGSDPSLPNWLDTGGRTRGFVTFRWLDNPDPPLVDVRVRSRAEVTA